MKTSISILMNRDAVWSTIWSTIQQVVVASSTYFILEAIRNITSGKTDAALIYIGAFVASLVLVYLPNTLSMVYLQRWRLTSVENFVRSFIDYNKGQTSFGHSRNKSKTESWLTNESFTVLDTATNLLYQIYSTLTNSVFNILVIALALDIRILGWYFLAGGVLVASNFFFRTTIASASLAVQGSRNELSTSMLSAWQNIFVGNQHNFENWHSIFSDRMTKARTAATSYDLTRSLISSGTVSVALLIVAMGNGIFLWDNRERVSLMAALLITLPRQLQIIQSIFAFFNLTLSWTGTREQLRELEAVIRVSQKPNESMNYVKFEEIELFNGKECLFHQDFDSIKRQLKTFGNGRWTLRARNGAGKSTLLSLLKEDMGEEAFLLPTNYEDLAFKTDFLNHSDGNRLLSVFQRISELENIKIIILDEWDANLDGINLSRINDMIEKLSANKIVVESRHRR